MELCKLINEQDSHSIVIPIWHPQSDNKKEQLYYVITGIAQEMPRQDSYGIDSFLLSSKVKQGDSPFIGCLFTGLRIMGFMRKPGNELNDEYVTSMQSLLTHHNNQKHASFEIQRGVNGWYLSAKRPVAEEKYRPEALSALLCLMNSTEQCEYKPEFYWQHRPFGLPNVRKQVEFAFALFAKEASQSLGSFLLDIANEMNDARDEDHEETVNAQGGH